MLVLTTADKIEVERSSTANVDCTGHYVDTTASTPGLAVATFSTASTGDLIVAPGADLRMVKSIYICNRHASTTNTIKVKLDKSATEYILCIATLQASDTLIYDDSGWYILSATGNRVSPFVMSGDGTLDAAGVLTLGVSAITGKTEDTSPLDDDFTLTYDTSAAALKKVLLSNLNKPYPLCICAYSTATVLGNGTVTSIRFDATDTYDPDGLHNHSGGAGVDERVSLSKAGIWLVGGSVGIATNATGRRYVNIAVTANGGTVAGSSVGAQQLPPVGGGVDNTLVNAHAMFYVSSVAGGSPYVVLQGFHNNGVGNLNTVNANLWAARISA